MPETNNKPAALPENSWSRFALAVRSSPSRTSSASPSSPGPIYQSNCNLTKTRSVTGFARKAVVPTWYE
jgi:hypothetical protein